MLWQKDGQIYRGGGVIVDGLRHLNPSAEQFTSAGYTEFTHPAPEPAPPPDSLAFDAACAKFRQLCAKNGAAAGIENFRGGFDEMAAFQASTVYGTVAGLQLAVAWSAVNELCKYEGSKLGYGQPDWWYRCWEVADA